MGQKIKRRAVRSYLLASYFILISFNFILFTPHLLFAKILDVKTDGSGDFLTIAEAIAAAGEGDLVLIGPGTFNETIEIRKSNLTLAGSGADITRIEVTGNSCLSIENSSNIRIEDISFFTHSEMGDSTVYIDNSYVEISYCVVESSPDAYGIYSISDSSVKIIHNTILHNKKEGAVRFDNSCEMVIKSNILMGNSFGINNLGKQFASPDISHNLLWKNDIDYNNCKKGQEDISADPLFKNPGKKDYSLKSSSPCIGVSHDDSDIGAFPLIKRIPRKKVRKVLPPELSLSATLMEPGGDGILNGGEDAYVKVIISNSGKGPAYNVLVSYYSTSTIIGEGRQEISYLPPNAEEELTFPLPIPTEAADEETSIQLKASDKEGNFAEPVTMNVPILSVLGRLSIDADPEKSLVYLDDTLYGEIPLSIENLLPKTYRIRITLTDYAEVNETITLEPRADEVRQFVLLKLKGDLLVETDPPGAKIIFQDHEEGLSPLKITFKDVGTYEISAEKYTPEKIYRFKGQVTIKPGENRIKIDRFTTVKVPPGMILIPYGEFTMGSDKGSPNETPVHKVFLKSYYIDKYEVSWADFLKYIKAESRPKPFYAGDPRFNVPGHPAVGITFNEAEAYAEWLNKRLPTEAEWEKAAKGNKNLKYPWGNEFAVNKVNCAIDADGYQTTAPVDSFPIGANSFGLLNMVGNIWEWCSDFYNATYYYVSPSRNPKGPKNETRRILRGGSWNDSRFDARTTRRWSYWPDLKRNYIGLRLVFPSES